MPTPPHSRRLTLRAASHLIRTDAAAFAIRTIPLLAEAASAGTGAAPQPEAPVEMASWWTFSDLLDEGWLTGTPFYGGFGLLTTQGVAKPAYRAFELLSKAGERRLEGVTVTDPAPDYPSVQSHSTVSVIATVEGSSSSSSSSSPLASASRGLQLFVTNFAPMAGATGAPWTPRARNVSLTLRFPPTNATGSSKKALRGHRQGEECVPPRSAQLQRIDDQVTAPRAAWEAMGRPPYPSKQQLAALDAASQMPQESVPLRRVGGAASCEVNLMLELPAYGVAHLGGFA